jgi:hypothetical protein
MRESHRKKEIYKQPGFTKVETDFDGVMFNRDILRSPFISLQWGLFLGRFITTISTIRHDYQCFSTRYNVFVCVTKLMVIMLRRSWHGVEGEILSKSFHFVSLRLLIVDR